MFWAERLKASGVLAIFHGRIIGDDNAFGRRNARAWMGLDCLLGDGYAAGLVRRTPQRQPKTWSSSPAISARAKPSGRQQVIAISTDHDSAVWRFATISPSASPGTLTAITTLPTARQCAHWSCGERRRFSAARARYIGVDNPTQFFVNAYGQNRPDRSRCIEVEGPAIDIDDPPGPPARVSGRYTSLATYRSPRCHPGNTLRSRNAYNDVIETSTPKPFLKTMPRSMPSCLAAAKPTGRRSRGLEHHAEAGSIMIDGSVNCTQLQPGDPRITRCLLTRIEHLN